jgi:hypothetical protein
VAAADRPRALTTERRLRVRGFRSADLAAGDRSDIMKVALLFVSGGRLSQKPADSMWQETPAMNISSSSLSQLSSVTATAATRRVSQAQTTDTASSTDETTGSSRTKLSKLGELMSKLQDLESSDPAKAKQVLTQIASSLTDKANSSSDPRLKELADKFTEAASTGDLSGLEPSGPPPGGGTHRGGHPPGPPPSDDSTTSTSETSATKSGRIARYSEAAKADRVDLESIVSDALSSVSQ